MNDQNTAVADSTEQDAPVFEKGSWQYDLQQSTALLTRAGNARKKASSLLWHGAKVAIIGWLPDASTDASGENLYSEALTALGKSRKGDASKIKTVAIASREHGLNVEDFDNLSKAYAEARRLTVQVAQDKEDDDAAEAAIEKIEVPKSTTTPEGAAAILLGKGVDGAVVAILDALNGPSGENNEAAHRSFLRAVATEIAARVKAKTDAEAAAKKAQRDAEAAKRAAEAAKKATSAPKKTAATAPKKATTKAKPVKKATTKATATVSPEGEGTPATPKKRPATKGRPIRRPAPASA